MWSSKWLKGRFFSRNFGGQKAVEGYISSDEIWKSQPRILYPTKLSFKNEGEMKTFSNKAQEVCYQWNIHITTSVTARGLLKLYFSCNSAAWREHLFFLFPDSLHPPVLTDSELKRVHVIGRGLSHSFVLLEVVAQSLSPALLDSVVNSELTSCLA